MASHSEHANDCNSIENIGDNLNVLQETKTGLRQDGDRVADYESGAPEIESGATEINSKCLNDSREMDIDPSKVKAQNKEDGESMSNFEVVESLSGSRDMDSDTDQVQAQIKQDENFSNDSRHTGTHPDKVPVQKKQARKTSNAIEMGLKSAEDEMINDDNNNCTIYK